MKCRDIRFAAVLLLAAGFVAPVHADADFRCGSALVKLGMSRADVRAACGDPTTEDVEDQDVRSGKQVVGRTAVYRWTYSGYGATRVLVFDQDRLISID